MRNHTRFVVVLTGLTLSLATACDPAQDKLAACGETSNGVLFDDANDFDVCALFAMTLANTVPPDEGFDVLVVGADTFSNNIGLNRVDWTVQLEDEANKSIQDGTALPDTTASVNVNGTNCGDGVHDVVVTDISVDGTSGTVSLTGVVESCAGTLQMAVRDATLTAYEGAPAR